MIATLLKADGTETKVSPADHLVFTLKELQNYVGGLIEFVDLPQGGFLVVNEEGKLIAEPIKNEKATEIFIKNYPLETYPHNNDQLICGDVLYFDKVNAELMNGEDRKCSICNMPEDEDGRCGCTNDDSN